ncbi:ABC transporter ATP-binding protein (plasmid) [Rossellomorea sp. FS2]|uniref:ABC transporter ATP-binding protein n=1 Tax=Rossellomorea sp. FS2 TaxID=3391447 RepID=UPI003A4D37AB
MLILENISKKYENNQVVKGVTISVNPGEITGIIGPNGAGKTTLLNMIVGLLKPTEGEIRFNNTIQRNNKKEFLQQIAYIPDSLFLYDNLTGREYVTFMASLWQVNKKQVETDLEFLAKKFFMAEKLDNFIRTYSKGMKQKISLIGALIHRPKLLILDEPFNGLDPESSRVIKKYFSDYIKKGNSILFSSHILELVEKLCDKFIILSQGEVRATGNLDQIRSLSHDNKEDLEEIFYDLIKKEA